MKALVYHGPRDVRRTLRVFRIEAGNAGDRDHKELAGEHRRAERAVDGHVRRRPQRERPQHRIARDAQDAHRWRVSQRGGGNYVSLL
ncbi:MAG: hypothetical protein M3414_02715 [Pseudomonadota bacterium]|nr:hypothetical protein [Pseudomonadota bacterium]